MSLNTLQALLQALVAPQRTAMFKATATTNGAGFYHSTWLLGGEPAAGAAAGSLNGAVPTNATAGSLPIRDPAAGNTLYLAGVQGVNGSERMLLSIFDRVWHNSGIDCSIATSQAIVSPAWSRWTDGIGLELWVECYTAWGASAFTMDVTYLDTASASSTATHTQPADAPVAGQAFRVPLASGDLGILSVSAAQLSGSSGAAGNMGLTVCKRICDISIPASGVVDLDWSQTGLVALEASPCLFGVMAAQASSMPGPAVAFMLAEG